MQRLFSGSEKWELTGLAFCLAEFMKPIKITDEI